MFKLELITKKIFLPTLTLLTLSACGSGSDSPEPTPPPAPVADTTPPVLTLAGEDRLELEVYDEFSDPGATATDDRDGNVTVSVSGEVDPDTFGEYTLTYSATDAAGNQSTVTRVVVVADTTAPAIELIDSGDLVLERGQEYREQGATALDNYDGDTDVVVESDIDTETVGTYTVTYRSTDSSGNVGTVERQITVNPLNVTLTVDQFGEGDVTVVQGGTLDCSAGSNCVVHTTESSTVILDAAPNAPWILYSWRGCDEVEGLEEGQCSITLASDAIVSATFAPNNEGYTYQLNANAVELTEELKGQIVDFNESTGVITFSRDADLSLIQVGSILVSTGVVDSNGVLTEFFLKRVDEIIGNSNSLKLVRTSEASIVELVDEGTFVWQGQLTEDDIDINALPPGLKVVKSSASAKERVESESSSTPIEFLASNLVLYDRDGNVATKEDQISLSGGFKLYLNPDFALDIDFPATVNEFRSIVYVDFNTEAGLDIGGTVTIAERRLAALDVNFTPIPIGPVVLVPAMTLNIVFKAEAGIEIKPRIVLSTDIVAGARYRASSGWDGVSDLDFDASVNDWSETVTLKAQAALGPELQYSTRLYGLAGPNIAAKGVLGIEALPLTDSETCILDVNTFMEASASFGSDVKIITKRFAYSVDLIKYKRIISSLSRECDSGIPDAPTELTVTQGEGNSLELEWLAVGDGSEITYKIVRDNIGIESEWLSSDYVDEDLTVGQEYCYAVIAKDDLDNESASSEVVCATVNEPDNEAPSAPTGLIAEGESSSAIRLTWQPSTDNVNVAGYTVYQINGTDSRPIQILDSNQADVLQLSPATEYCFAVSAFDDNGNVSELSGEACASTLDAEFAAWTMFIKCSSRSNYVVEESFDLDEGFTENILVAGQATDYSGGEMFYSMFGTYSNETSIFNGEINWSFENSSNLRKDTFSVDLSVDDTGDVAMNQVQVTGCNADIRFVNSAASPDSVPDTVTENKLSSGNRATISGN